MKLSVKQIKQLKATGRFDPMPENWWIVCVEDLDGETYPVSMLGERDAGRDCDLTTNMLTTGKMMDFYLRFV